MPRDTMPRRFDHVQPCVPRLGAHSVFTPGGILSAHDRFDRAYYDRWYRHPRRRVSTLAARQRRVSLALSVAEYLLERPVRTVLDVGCGEGFWRAPLKSLRPRIEYTGVDPSAYAVRRYGARRGILLGAVDTLETLPLRASYDLVVCADVLHFLPAREVDAGLASIASRTTGLAYVPIFTMVDDVEGDVRAMQPRGPAWYRDRMRRAGLVPLGLDCYIPSDALDLLSALERPPAAPARRRA